MAMNSSEEAKDTLKEQTEQAKNKAQETSEQVWSNMKKFMEKMRENTDDWAHNLRSSVKMRPIQAIAIASLVGFLVGSLCGKNKKD